MRKKTTPPPTTQKKSRNGKRRKSYCVCQVTPASGIGGESPQSGDSVSGERLAGSGLSILIVPCPWGRGVLNRAAGEQPGRTLMELGVPHRAREWIQSLGCSPKVMASPSTRGRKRCQGHLENLGEETRDQVLQEKGKTVSAELFPHCLWQSGSRALHGTQNTAFTLLREETSRVICSLDTMRLPTSYNNMIKRNNSFISTRITAIGRIVKQELGWGETGTVIYCWWEWKTIAATL